MEIIRIVDTEKESTMLESFYSIFEKAFPDEDERVSMEDIRYYLNHHVDNNDTYMFVALDEGKVVGGLIADYFSNCNSALIDYIFVDSEYRKNHCATSLINYFNGCVDLKAQQLNHEKCDYIFSEVENPKQMKHPDDFALGRIVFWNKKNFKKLDFNYLQAPLSTYKKSVYYLDLYCNINNSALENSIIPTEIVSKFLYASQKFASQIERPEENKEFKKMEYELKKRVAIGFAS